MKRMTLSILVVFTALLSAQAADKVQITATRKFGKNQIGRNQNVGSVSGRLNARAVHYEFKIRSVTPNENRFTAEWVVLADTMGLVMPVDNGQRTFDLKIGQATTLATEPVDKKKLKLRNIPEIGDADLEKKIQGYGIRVLDGNRNVVGEKYSSSRVEANARTMLAKLSRTTKTPTSLDQLIREILKKVKSLPLPKPPKGPPPFLKR